MYYDNIFALALFPGDRNVEWSLCAYIYICKHLQVLIAEIKSSALEVTLKHAGYILNVWSRLSLEAY